MQEYVFGYFVKYQYAWVFEEAELFERPFPTTGKRGLWDFNEKMCLKRMENETGETFGSASLVYDPDGGACESFDKRMED